MTSSQKNLDRNQRNALRTMVTQCRRILEDEIATLLEGQFGVHRNGTVEDASKLRQLSAQDVEYREQIVAYLRHIEAGGYKPADAAAQLVREVAFTHLNRLCAFKLMEHPERKLIREAIRRGLNSNGFKFYLGDHPEDEQLWSDGKEDRAYRHFLVWQGAQLSGEIGALFAPNDPANRLFPKQKVLEQILDLLNDPEMEPIWAEDETIGWVYQYFTPKELRDQVRKESQAPRNSYELAFRNQFFTPRYVVRFLTDNTLGRIWYEMLQGDSVLGELCTYLVHRPSEVFLAEDEPAPQPDASAEEQLSQEDLLRRPVYVPYRGRKDPRDLHVIDPAAGSGHFLLYAFDLLLAIYEEAWAKQDAAPAWAITGKALHEDYPTLDALRRAAPSLILRYNLFGIDIDLRATQIAALALWLRAQRAYQEYSIPAKDRAAITRVNIVCAEPMPGEKAMLDEFVAGLQPVVLGQLVSRVFDKMRLADEAGSLLKIEEELRDEIEVAKHQWRARPRHEQLSLFPEPKRTVAEQMTLYEVEQITDEEFWNEAEGRVLEALREYAEHTTEGQRYSRGLFADDAARGFAFIDVCRRRYDVVLMNPPFGAASKGWKPHFERAYPRTKNDLYAAFVERGLFWLHQRGMLGAITSRTGFFTKYFQQWREELLLHKAQPVILADLGQGILDTAAVETAAYCLRIGNTDESIFLRLLSTENKVDTLNETIETINNGNNLSHVFRTDPTAFKKIPSSPFSYWVSNKVRQLFIVHSKLQGSGRDAQFGTSTKNDFRFLRAWWEINSDRFAWSRNATFKKGKWVSFEKGGSVSSYYRDWELVLDWEEDGKNIKDFISEYRGIRGWGYQWSASINGHDRYFKAGIAWSRRSEGLSFRILQEGCIFADKGPAIFLDNSSSQDLLQLCAILNSMPFKMLVSIQLGRFSLAQSFELGIIQQTPVPNSYTDKSIGFSELALTCVNLKRDLDRTNETSHVFHLPALLQVAGATLAERAMGWANNVAQTDEQLAAHQREIDDIAFKLYGIEGEDRKAIETSMGSASAGTELEEDADADDNDGDEQPSLDQGQLAKDLISYLVGSAFGRWDIRYATGEIPTPELPDPFAPLPACSPGMLTGEDGLPLQHAPQGYPLPIAPDGILVDDPGHPHDIARRARGMLEIIFGEQAEAIERELCQTLGLSTLCDYFQRPGNGGFWMDHIRRYSKSRRKAPIYWLLQSPKKNYALWIYYHRLDSDLLFKAQVNYVDPKIRQEEERLATLVLRKQSAGSPREVRQTEREIEKQEALINDLREFRDRLERAAKLDLTPDLNDGVVLTIAPLHELVPWKEAKQYWDELLAGKYEWSSIGKQLREKGLVQ